MGKSKKSHTKVDAAAAVVTQCGKRGAKDAIEKTMSAKKQKVERDAAVVLEQKIEKKLPRNPESDDNSDTIFDDEPTEAPSPKRGKPSAKTNKADVSSEKSSDATFDEEAPTAQPMKSSKNSESSDSNSKELSVDDSEDDKGEKKSVKPSLQIPKKKDADVEMVDADEPQKTSKTPATLQATGSKILFVGNLSYSVEEADVLEFFKSVGKVVDVRFAINAEGKFRGFGYVEFDTAEDAQKALELHEQPLLGRKVKLDLAREREAAAHTPHSGGTERMTFGKDPPPLPMYEPVKLKHVPTFVRRRYDKIESYDSDSEELSVDGSKDDKGEKKSAKPSLQTPKKKDADVEIVDADEPQKTSKTPATLQATMSKILFVGNLSFSVVEADVLEFFKSVGKVLDVRFAMNAEGKFRGFGYVEFDTAEAAQKALELHEQQLLGRKVRLDLVREPLLGRKVRLDLAREMEAGSHTIRSRLDLACEREAGAHTPCSRDNYSFQRGDRRGAQGKIACVKGFDISLREYKIRIALEEHFGPCGEIAKLSIPLDLERIGVQSIAYIEFTSNDALIKALELDGSEAAGGLLNVQEAEPSGDNGGRIDSCGISGGSRGGKDGGGGQSRGCRGGRRGGRG